MNNLDKKNNDESSVTVTDINNLQSLQQQHSSQRLRIKIDPTITTVSDIELTSRENDNDHYSPPLPDPATPALVPKSNLDKLCFDTESQLNTARSTARGAAPVSARCIDGDSQDSVINSMNDTNRRHSIKIPSQYVEDRFKNIDNQLSYGRRKRNKEYYKNCTIIWIRNIIIFYILFIIGMFFLYMCTDMLQSITFGYNQTNTNCSCQHIKSNEDSTDSTIINNTNIQYIPIPPKFWQQQLDNLTAIVKNMIDVYFTTSGAQYIENSTDFIVNNTINRLQTTALHRMYIDEIISKQIDTNIITSDIIYTNKINTTDLYSTNINSTNINSTIINSLNIFGTNLTTSLINTLNIITDIVQSTELFGNTLNKCTVGKC
jgi:hypothetical protein